MGGGPLVRLRISSSSSMSMSSSPSLSKGIPLPPTPMEKQKSSSPMPRRRHRLGAILASALGKVWEKTRNVDRLDLRNDILLSTFKAKSLELSLKKVYVFAIDRNPITAAAESHEVSVVDAAVVVRGGKGHR